MKKILLSGLLCLLLNVGFTQNITANSNSQSLENVKVPDFSNLEIRDSFISYQNNLINYLKVVKQNNKPAIKAAFDKDVSNFDKMQKMLEKAKASGSAEYKKLLAYLNQTKPYIKEISQSPYVKELSKEYLKKYEKN